MRITTAGMLLLLPRLSTNTGGTRTTSWSVSDLIQNRTVESSASHNSCKLPVSHTTGVLRKGTALLASLDRKFIIGLQSADAAEAMKSKSPLEKISYNKGDNADSISDFAEAVSDEYTVFSNKNAYDKEKFKNKVIMIYGEDHRTPLLPSIRNDKGALLLESPDPDRCLAKHQLYPDNICKYIDTADTSMLYASTKKLHSLVGKLVQQLDPMEYRRMEKKRREPKTPPIVILHDMMHFVNENFKRIYSAQSKPVQKELGASYRLATSAFEEHEKLQKSTLQDRDAGMVLEIKKVVAEQKSGEATTIVVGNAHVRGVFNALAKEFRGHAIVGCFSRPSATSARDRDDGLVKGIDANPVKIPASRTRTEL